MPKNKIQFQRGLSLQRFQQLYGTSAQCQEVLLKKRWPSGFVCPQCNHTLYYKLATRPLYQCQRCRCQTSLTSGTIFDSSKLPLTIWFLAIYLISQSKDGLSSLNLARILGVSANAGLRLKHKLQQVMKNEDDRLQLSGIVQVDDAYWGGKKHDGKRGRGASGKTPFLAAVSTNCKGHPIHMRLSRVRSFTSAEVSRWSAKHLQTSTLVVSDGLHCFSGIAQSGFLHETIITGGGYESMQIKVFSWVNTMLGNVKKSIHGTYHSVSRKHLPRYLAEFCFRFNRRFNLGFMVGALVKASAHSKPIPQHKLKLAEIWW
ncbi:MAG: IS1595 family transposase [Desulforudis sp.]|jgi:transposase-like protein|nr:MAG: IS1595 family transposase [Desulforudis sp.]